MKHSRSLKIELRKDWIAKTQDSLIIRIGKHSTAFN